MNTEDLSFRDIDWLASLRGIRSLRDFARIKQVQVAQVSKVFRKIEGCVGDQLFARSAAGITLTQFGESYATWAEEFLIQFHQFQRDQKNTPGDQVFSIGSYAFLQNSLVLAAIANTPALSEHRFRILELNPLYLSQVQQIDAIPIVLHLGTIPWPTTMHSTEVGKIRFNFYIGRAFYQPGLKARDLEAIPFIAPAYYSDGRVSRGSDRCPIPLHRRRIGDETSTVQQAVRLMQQRKQIAFLPDCAVQEALKSGQIQRLVVKDTPSVEEKLILTVKSDRVPQGLNRTLLESLRRELKNQE